MEAKELPKSQTPFCKATKEGLLRDITLSEHSWCPICEEDFGIRCRVANHCRVASLAPTAGKF